MGEKGRGVRVEGRIGTKGARRGWEGKEKKEQEEKRKKTEKRVKDRKGGGRNKRRGKMEEIRLVSWNCAELRKKEGRFWEYLKRFDVIALTETIEGLMRKLRGYEIEIKKA